MAVIVFLMLSAGIKTEKTVCKEKNEAEIQHL